MPDHRRTLPLLALAVLAAMLLLGVRAAAPSRPAGPPADRLGEVHGARYRLSSSSPAGAVELPASARAAGLTFAADVAPPDRAAVLAAVAGARPAARRLIALVDGLVDVQVGRPASGAAGVTMVGGARYPVTLDLTGVRARSGERGVARLVLHELGHVVDHALLPDALVDRLDARIPRGYGCERGVTGACAPEGERFAESFAKWATGDIGMNVDLGYEVPPPLPLDGWGAPLETFGT